MHINYVEKFTQYWKAVAKAKINRSQSYYLKNSDAIEFNLWRSGAIRDCSLFYLAQDKCLFNHNTLLYIICSPNISDKILDDLENNSNVPQLTKECIIYLK